MERERKGKGKGKAKMCCLKLTHSLGRKEDADKAILCNISYKQAIN